MSLSDVFKRMLKHRRTWRLRILVPVLVVVGLWIVMSTGTTLYLWWVQAEYDRVFAENLTSINAAHTLESLTWRVISDWQEQDEARFQSVWKVHQQEIHRQLEIVKRNVHSPEESAARESIVSLIAEMSAIVESASSVGDEAESTANGNSEHLRLIAFKVSQNASELRRVNDQLISESRSHLLSTHSLVLLARILLLALGPMLGIILGWRVARELQSSVSDIAVTLSDSSLGDESAGFCVSITRESSFEDVQRQAERVVERLRRVANDLQAARREVIQAERRAAVGELAAGVAHELRNPLTSVKLLLQYVSRQTGETRIAAGQLELILDEVGRMERTIQGLLDFSRTPSLNCTQHDLRETIQRSLNLTEGRLRQSGIQVVTGLPDAPLLINGDAEQLNQVFVNLFLNSAEAMTGGGELCVSAEITADESAVDVQVDDTGPGIPPEMHDRLFEPFSTTKERGTGLGLAISRRIINDHLGAITVQNRHPSGASFRIRLPLSVATL